MLALKDDCKSVIFVKFEVLQYSSLPHLFVVVKFAFLQCSCMALENISILLSYPFASKNVSFKLKMGRKKYLKFIFWGHN